MNEYLVVVEKAESNYAAFSPDLPGCVATGTTREEALERMRQAIALHLQGLKEDGLPIPESSSSAEYLAV
ncbi:MAG: type II toxin-antitoxin system HicB family antitoxin [Actinomycetota bacterium]|nr:type II toxin-antitoxin system HicB family antitoxin [Actinomycetota bacterium]